MRLARSVDYLIEAEMALDLPVGLTRTMTVVDLSNRALRMVMDHIMWAHRVGLIRVNYDRIGRYSSTFWLLGMVTALSKNARQMEKLLVEEDRLTRLGDVEAASRVRARQSRVGVSLLIDAFNLPVPLHGLGLTPRAPTGLVNLSGAVASALGLWQLWDKTA
eukprot:UC1_evm1s1978